MTDTAPRRNSAPRPAAPGAFPTRSSAEFETSERRLWFYVAILTGVLTFCFLWSRIVITIPAGYQGVLFSRFHDGTVTDRSYREGLHLIAPWNQMIAYETRLQSRVIELKVPSDEGLEMEVSLALRFRPYGESLGHLHQDIGPDYFNRLILPEVQGHLRKILGKRKAQDIYTGARDILEEIARVPVLCRLRKVNGGSDVPGPTGEPGTGASTQPYVLLEELRVLDIKRPAVIADAVNEKQRQEQLSLEYRHRLQREQQESERKRVEAAGIRDYNSTIGSLNPDVLRWKNIEATLELSRANNSKVVVLGSGQQAPPLMLNMDATSAGTPTAANPPSASAGSGVAATIKKPEVSSQENGQASAQSSGKNGGQSH